MKYVVVVVSLIFISTLASGQDSKSATSSDVHIIKFSWSKERINWAANPFGGPNENFHEMQFRTRAEKRASDARRANSPEANKLEKDAQADAAIIQAERNKKGPARYAFLYKLSVKNNGHKTIKELDWDYVFFDAATGAEIGRRQFTGVEKIGPGKNKELIFQVSSPPAKTISIYSLDKSERKGLSEAVVLVRVAYADGSVWLGQ